MSRWYNLKYFPPQHLVHLKYILLIGITPWSFECIIIIFWKDLLMGFSLSQQPTHTVRLESRSASITFTSSSFNPVELVSSQQIFDLMMNAACRFIWWKRAKNDCALCKQTSGNSYVNTINFVCHVYNNWIFLHKELCWRISSFPE